MDRYYYHHNDQGIPGQRAEVWVVDGQNGYRRLSLRCASQRKAEAMVEVLNEAAIGPFHGPLPAGVDGVIGVALPADVH